jgi:CheY-like chemotaxis protein
MPPARRVWSLNVLVIDDDVADTELILSVLKRHPDVSAVRAADSPELALRQFAGGHHLRPDLILLDIQMPRMNGFAFLAAMRRIPAVAHVPVVFLTTSKLASDVARMKDSSASLYVIKPDSYFELQARLNGVLKRATSGRWERNDP